MRRARLRAIVAAFALATLSATPTMAQEAPNQVVGTWRMVSAHIERADGTRIAAYGNRPSGLLIFAPDMHYVEVLTNGDLPPFASGVRGEGTDAENRAAMASSIGMFGTYTVDADGAFSGNRVEGATFPNWIGNVRTTRELRLVVDGDTMTEQFTRPDGTQIEIVFARVR
ncbi:lipocalin-like domain-containing protein [Acuticoccus sp. M5D2P5]|uniref:lipocalin-like domain-containing protein n=1 Tax=Acuticoccus kalidii TaxID=2910977 RepID=UPI001F31A35A|nr:lipocalin-like domain-containing protein [Acuticoccus kalidii]MCF3934060.1 lipocalin-like domain-containing protein [Acuticoccus kalidii]